jgi:hypothetical protein
LRSAREGFSLYDGEKILLYFPNCEKIELQEKSTITTVCGKKPAYSVPG